MQGEKKKTKKNPIRNLERGARRKRLESRENQPHYQRKQPLDSLSFPNSERRRQQEGKKERQKKEKEKEKEKRYSRFSPVYF